MYDEILYEVTDPVATITLNRPDQLNAWTNRMGTDLRGDPRDVALRSALAGVTG